MTGTMVGTMDACEFVDKLVDSDPPIVLVATRMTKTSPVATATTATAPIQIHRRRCGASLNSSLVIMFSVSDGAY